MSQNPTTKKEVKQLKLSTPFEPQTHQQYIQGYYPSKFQQDQNYYNQNYAPIVTNQQTIHEQGNTINSLSLNGNNNSNQNNTATQNSSNGQQPQPNIQKIPKKKLALNNANPTNIFILDQNVEKKVDQQQKKEEQKKLEEQKRLEEEKRKNEEENQRLLELKKPKSYSKEDLKKFVDAINDFSQYFDKEEWQLLKNRTHFNTKEIQTKNQPRKGGKTNTDIKTSSSNQQRNQNKQTATVQPFDRAQIQPATETQPKITIVRVVEDIQTKQLKDRMKSQAEEFFQTLNQTPDQREIIFQEFRFRLNQLAPDNFELISQKILKIVIENKKENDSTYLEFLAQKIIEKSQTEPKYRKLYSSLCSMLTKEPQLIIPKVNKKGKVKNVSLFKNQLLNQVQKVFYERKNKNEDLSHMKPEEREKYHLSRKSKIMGNVRFIGDLFLSTVLPLLAVENAIRDLVSDYVAQYQPNQENSEESIEGLIELLDQIGAKYNNQNTPDIDLLKESLEVYFDGTTKNLEETKKFLSQFQRKLSIDIIFEIFNILVCKYKLSQRITMLIENVQERRKQGWKDHYSRQDQAQSAKTIQLEQEKEIIEQNYNQSKSKNKKYQAQQVLYVEKNSSQQPSSPSPQQDYQLFDLNELANFVQGTFKKEEAQQQEAKLLEELKRIGGSDEAIQIFFDNFFESLFSYKLFKQNTERAQMVFELLSKAEAKEQIVKKATQKALKEDIMYSLAELPTAANLLVTVIGYFLNDSDINSLKKLYLKPELDLQDFYDFMAKVANQLIAKYSDRENIIKEYFSILGYQL